VRTLAIAGGSLLRLDPRGQGVSAVRDVGPRSAHIAGLGYASFTPPAALAGARMTFVRPQRGDPDDYVALELRDGTRCGLTPTCAANLLEYVPPEAFARADAESARLAFEIAGAHVGCTAEALAGALLDRATQKLRAAIEELIDDYELDPRTLELVGGGGGAAALVPYAAEALHFEHRLARDAEVISPLGVALALVRDVVERTIPNPSPEDVVAMRREAIERVVAAGAAPELVETVVEIDTRRNLVRATASGASAAVAGEHSAREASDDERSAAAARALHVAPETLERTPAGPLAIYRTTPRRGSRDGCIVDATGVVRLIAQRIIVQPASAGNIESVLANALEDATTFGDVGRALPEAYLVYRRRIANLGALAEASHVVALALEELRGLPPETEVQIVLVRRRA